MYISGICHKEDELAEEQIANVRFHEDLLLPESLQAGNRVNFIHKGLERSALHNKETACSVQTSRPKRGLSVIVNNYYWKSFSAGLGKLVAGSEEPDAEEPVVRRKYLEIRLHCLLSRLSSKIF